MTPPRAIERLRWVGWGEIAAGGIALVGGAALSSAGWLAIGALLLAGGVSLVVMGRPKGRLPKWLRPVEPAAPRRPPTGAPLAAAWLASPDSMAAPPDPPPAPDAGSSAISIASPPDFSGGGGDTSGGGASGSW